ncbi:MAG: NUDIX domain-containing protein [Candidatus Dormiibacterota bacterium]
MSDGVAAFAVDGRPSRRGVRVLLLDPDDRLVLLCARDPLDPARGSFWFTTGGGAEPGETAEQTARREVAEEVGIRGFDLGPLVWRERTRFTFNGIVFDQANDFYLGRTAVTDLDVSGQVAIERETIQQVRWWTGPELAGTPETIYPLGLAGLLAALLREGPPPAPIELPPHG